MPQDVCRAGMAQKMSVYTIFSPRIARTEEFSPVLYQLLIFLQAGYLPSRIVLFGPSS